MSDANTKNNVAWEKLFSKYEILGSIKEHGEFRISANNIREFREPRLMAKFDHTINLPKIFSDHGLSLLPVTRGDYIISDFNTYHKLEEASGPPFRVCLPEHIQSLDPDNIISETMAVNVAVASGMLNHFLEENELFASVSGRMGSGEFIFDILRNSDKKVQILVKNSQIEIDAAYEGINSLSLIEAKRDISEDFLIRQLYYPFRAWNGRITKKVRPIFFVYTNGIFNFYEYEFIEPQYYNSLQLVNSKKYSIEDTTIEFNVLQDIARGVVVVREPDKVPFPQANNFNRVVNLCELLMVQGLSKEEVTDEYAFDKRQTDYYTNAGVYLGLIENNSGTYSLSTDGLQIMKYGYKRRQLALVERILQHKVFLDTFKAMLIRGDIPEKSEIVEIMMRAELSSMGEKTYERRSSTVVGWIKWILDLITP